jgi:hypothetical protein
VHSNKGAAPRLNSELCEAQVRGKINLILLRLVLTSRAYGNKFHMHAQKKMCILIKALRYAGSERVSSFAGEQANVASIRFS